VRLYYTGASPNNLRKARLHAPSHTHGYGWTPQKMTPHDGPYFVDCGAYSGHFEAEAYYETLDRALRGMPTAPDFFVLPDVYGSAQSTVERHREWLYERQLPVGSGECMRYWVLQPGLPLRDQFEAIEGCQGVFVGGPKRWKRAHGREIVELAADYSLRTHVGNPSGVDGLVWAARCGFDSCDTTTIFQNGYWHYLERLEAVSSEATTVETPSEAGRQASIETWTA